VTIGPQREEKKRVSEDIFGLLDRLDFVAAGARKRPRSPGRIRGTKDERRMMDNEGQMTEDERRTTNAFVLRLSSFVFRGQRSRMTRRWRRNEPMDASRASHWS
jgi:hypothetical protein